MNKCPWIGFVCQYDPENPILDYHCVPLYPKKKATLGFKTMTICGYEVYDIVIPLYPHYPIFSHTPVVPFPASTASAKCAKQAEARETMPSMPDACPVGQADPGPLGRENMGYTAANDDADMMMKHKSQLLRGVSTMNDIKILKIVMCS